MRGVGRETTEIDSEGLSDLYKVTHTQLVKVQRQDLHPGMTGPSASALLSCLD